MQNEAYAEANVMLLDYRALDSEPPTDYVMFDVPCSTIAKCLNFFINIYYGDSSC